MKISRFHSFISVALLGFSIQVYADKLPVKSFSICKGEHDAQCLHATYHKGCRDSEEDFARGVCTVHSSRGDYVRDYTKVQTKVESANRCGYTTWQFKGAAE